MVAIYHADRLFACCLGNTDQGDVMDGLECRHGTTVVI
jgi:hypothetical protein